MLAILILAVPPPSAPTPSAPGADGHERPALPNPGGYFIANEGQLARPDIGLYSMGNPRVGFETGALSMVFEEPRRARSDPSPARGALADPPARGVLVRIRFEGSNPVIPVGREPLGFGTNFFVGNDPSGWRTNVPAYREVVYPDLYEGVDAIAHADPAGLKLEFHLRPGADPSAITMAYEGVNGVRLGAEGIALSTPLGEVRDANPVAWQGDRAVPCSFALRPAGSAGFECRDWRPAEPWVIDPLVYSTFLGGVDLDFGMGIAVDSGGNACVTGGTYSFDFPTTPGAYNTLPGPAEIAYVAKLNTAGSALLYSTFLGGTNGNRGESITVDERGQCSVLGPTQSADFPIVSGFDTTLNGTQNTFVAKLSVRGDRLLFSTYLGGSGNGASGVEEAGGIATCPGNTLCVSGDTSSRDFPITAGAVQSNLRGSSDAFLSRIDPTNGTLVYSTFLGGTGVEWGGGLATGPSGRVWVTGTTGSSDFPTTANGVDRTLSSEDAFAIEVDMTAGTIVYGTFLGGSGPEQGFSIALGAGGDIFATGLTQSSDFPGAVGAYAGNGDVFVADLDPSGPTLTARYLGGSGLDWGFAIAADPSGLVWVGGNTRSPDFPVSGDAFQGTLNGTTDGYVTKLVPTVPPPAGIYYSTFLGGTNRDAVRGIAVDMAGGLYVVGGTTSSDFPVTPGSFETTAPASENAITAKFGPSTPPSLPDLAIGPTDLSLNPPGPSIVEGTSVLISATVHNQGTKDASQVPVRFLDVLEGATIGNDQVVASLPAGGLSTVSVSWPAGPARIHRICAFADPDSLILESNEANNEACTTIQVTPAALPDLAIAPADVQVSPAPPVANGTAVQVNATARNVGNAPSAATTMRFYDGMPPAPQVGADQILGALPVGGSATVTAAWTAAPPGKHDLCVVVDPDDGVVELDEGNNLACASVVVTPPPETRPDYTPTATAPPSPVRVGLSLSVSLSLVVENVGNGTANRTATLAFFNDTTPASPFASFSVSPLASSAISSPFTATWGAPASAGTYRVVADVDYGDDLAEWNEANNRFTWVVDVVAGPVTTLVVGAPNYTASETYVTSSTPLSFSVLDQSGTGVRNTTYRVDGGPWANYTATGPFALAGEGAHAVEWFSEDNAGNVEPVANATLRVDNTPPTSVLTVGAPKYVAADTFVTSASTLTLAATDGGVMPVGLASTSSRAWSGTWSAWTSSPITLTGADGVRYVEYRSADRLGNEELVRNATLVLDDTPPTTMLFPANGPYPTATTFTLSSADAGSGVNVTDVRIDDGPWTPYASGISLAVGNHTISYRSVDRLGNREPERAQAIRVEGPPPPAAANLKPLVAAVFAAILALVGVWSARRAPRPTGSRRGLGPFAMTSLPFVLLESATGVVSLLTGLLAIPPLLGAGTAIDVSILAAGLAVAGYRVRRWTPPT